MQSASFSFLHPTLHPPGQLSGEKDVGQFALCVSSDRVVVFFPTQTIKLDPAHGVSSR